jgi:3-oxoacyl-[acyl-carrier-protein] synthase I
MPATEIVVVGVGSMTAVGLSAAETAASVRAATMRFTATTWRDQRFEPFTVAEIIEDGLPDLVEELTDDLTLTYREARLLRIGALPLVESLKPIAGLNEQPGLILALPSTETLKPLDGNRFLQHLQKQASVRFDLAKSECQLRGRAGGLLAIKRAGERLLGSKTDFMVAGGIDSYRDLFVLGKLDLEGRVKSSTNLDGFIPGEAAAFVLLTSRRVAESRHLTVLATLSKVINGFESGHLYSESPYRGDGLADTLRSLFQFSPPKTPVNEVYSSMNGENHWAKEWGVAFLRNRSFLEEAHRMNQPADCFGDIGAACGPLMVGLAAQGIAQGYRRSPALVYCSSDLGERAATIVSAG